MKIYQAEIIKNTLALVGENIPLEEIVEWTPRQVQEAEKWAARYYAKNIDKLSVRVPRKPGFLTKRTPNRCSRCGAIGGHYLICFTIPKRNNDSG